MSLLALTIAPATHAIDWEEDVSAWSSFTAVLSEIFDSLRQGVNGLLSTDFETSEGITTDPPPPEDDGSGDPESTPPPPPPPGPEDDDGSGGGNIGGGQDPWG